jgi:sulfur-carrier protein
VQIQIKYFASVREALGRSSESWETQQTTLVALRKELQARGEPWHTALAPEQPLRAALNQAMVHGDAELSDGDEVAYFPPVTGG